MEEQLVKELSKIIESEPVKKQIKGQVAKTIINNRKPHNDARAKLHRKMEKKSRAKNRGKKKKT